MDDPLKQVVEPCRILQSLSLPSELLPGANGGFVGDALNAIPTLSPPGPTPFTLEGLLGKSKPRGEITEEEVTSLTSSITGGDKILIEFGRFLNFFNVVIRSVDLTVPIKFDSNGNPISAKLNLVFETYEMMTVESLANSYKKIIPGVQQ